MEFYRKDINLLINSPQENPKVLAFWVAVHVEDFVFNKFQNSLPCYSYNHQKHAQISQSVFLGAPIVWLTIILAHKDDSYNNWSG